MNGLVSLKSRNNYTDTPAENTNSLCQLFDKLHLTIGFMNLISHCHDLLFYNLKSRYTLIHLLVSYRTGMTNGCTKIFGLCVCGERN